ncbi:MAG: RnfABCDGE type electron transport complex subunit G [Candidatus Omnitrophica bacterium]|nr:RnfABCDGE type electron transport complex subunit G [Candidatus Omnitrophota bacterium]MBU1047986.1 RnfABCDGE type electron transport complex subunit G [Candidatus Omnitrophota bacterium]MBU1631376.1 RnfABCDGE type electron transport complex subunit G [Candidatus Omnitrophota bacterium]MBU1767161.1 RnfABCDGE type electron transport complex subunit G [Candidatus Omnitrophota bacterium]MBU1889636.1 RnfABCDGE type electron transport complex subunit G [Candidatus Omnitrophota bacterium]
MKNKSLQIFIALGAVCLFSGGALAIMYNFTKTPIAENQQSELKTAIVKVLPSVKNYKEIKKTETITIYKGEDEKEEMLGYAVVGEGNGFQGKIKLIVGFDKDLTSFLGMEILESLETPGLGTRVGEEPFKKQVKSLKLKPDVSIGIVKDEKNKKETDIQAITGATISSTAVVEILNEIVKETTLTIK